MSSLETEIQVCSNNLATCGSNLTKEKDFATFQKEKNQELEKIITDIRTNNQILQNEISQNQRDNSTNIFYQRQGRSYELSYPSYSVLPVQDFSFEVTRFVGDSDR